MIRPIKFRAWDKKEKRYYYDAERTYDYQCRGYGCFEDNFGEVLDLSNRFIVEQYTGLKDKNGKEIYENDIVNICGIACTDDSEMACIIDTNSVVVWDKRYARFDVKDKPESKDWDYRRRRYYLFTDKDRNDVEVIGNVHENKELLDKNNQV